jgi:hypothetical protein
VTSIDVGTHDNDPNHYVNRIMPTGWNLTIVSASPLHNPVCTAHGQQSTAQDESTCPFVLHFSGTTTMSTNFTLGYDFTPNWDIHDAEWSADNGAIANWGRPVGMGFGPVHSPLMQ